jgi:hypothetical protein
MRRPLAPLLLTLSLLAGCGADPNSPEAQIEALFDAAESAAEARDIATLKTLVAGDYSDDRGHDRNTVVRVVQFHFLQNKSIHLFRQTRELSFPERGRAAARVLVAMAGTPIPDLAALRLARADLYRFDLELADRGGGDWAVTGAQWRRAELADFLP